MFSYSSYYEKTLVIEQTLEYLFFPEIFLCENTEKRSNLVKLNCVCLSVCLSECFVTTITGFNRLISVYVRGGGKLDVVFSKWRKTERIFTKLLLPVPPFSQNQKSSISSKKLPLMGRFPKLYLFYFYLNFIFTNFTLEMKL